MKEAVDDVPLSDTQRIETLKEFWIALQMSGDAGAASWDDLDPISTRVTEALYVNNLGRAEHLTCRAAAMIEGHEVEW
ncbi:MAG: hypothetical protein AAF797_11715 [Planctomycetota bacterium]